MTSLMSCSVSCGRSRSKDRRSRQDATALVGVTLQRRRGVRRAGHALRRDPWGLRPQIQGRRNPGARTSVRRPGPVRSNNPVGRLNKEIRRPNGTGSAPRRPAPRVSRTTARSRCSISERAKSVAGEARSGTRTAQDALTTTWAVQARQSADRLAHAWHTEPTSSGGFASTMRPSEHPAHIS
jgi:hypothetical protein